MTVCIGAELTREQTMKVELERPVERVIIDTEANDSVRISKSDTEGTIFSLEDAFRGRRVVLRGLSNRQLWRLLRDISEVLSVVN